MLSILTRGISVVTSFLAMTSFGLVWVWIVEFSNRKFSENLYDIHGRIVVLDKGRCA